MINSWKNYTHNTHTHKVIGKSIFPMNSKHLFKAKKKQLCGGGGGGGCDVGHRGEITSFIYTNGRMWRKLLVVVFLIRLFGWRKKKFSWFRKWLKKENFRLSSKKKKRKEKPWLCFLELEFFFLSFRQFFFGLLNDILCNLMDQQERERERPD